MVSLTLRTYIYIRPEDGKCVHSNCCGALIGKEYEHDDLNWQPSKDWPYEVVDLRIPEKGEAAMTENNIEYSGFVTPCLVLDRSDKEDKGMIVDFYSKTEDNQPLICGSWSKGFQDGLIHIYLMKPVTAMCDERSCWVAKQMVYKAPITNTEGVEEGGRIPKIISKQTVPKKQMKYDPETKQFRMM